MIRSILIEMLEKEISNVIQTKERELTFVGQILLEGKRQAYKDILEYVIKNP